LFLQNTNCLASARCGDDIQKFPSRGSGSGGEAVGFENGCGWKSDPSSVSDCGSAGSLAKYNPVRLGSTAPEAARTGMERAWFNLGGNEGTLACTTS
jgi:hypothetical protein